MSIDYCNVYIVLANAVMYCKAMLYTLGGVYGLSALFYAAAFVTMKLERNPYTIVQ